MNDPKPKGGLSCSSRMQPGPASCLTFTLSVKTGVIWPAGLRGLAFTPLSRLSAPAPSGSKNPKACRASPCPSGILGRRAGAAGAPLLQAASLPKHPAP